LSRPTNGSERRRPVSKVRLAGRFRGCAKEQRIVGQAEAATGRVPAALFGGRSCPARAPTASAGRLLNRPRLLGHWASTEAVSVSPLRNSGCRFILGLTGKHLSGASVLQ
jgi:hypothetical protein